MHGCPSLVNVVCCQVEVSASGRSLVQRSPSVVCLSVIVKHRGGPGPLGGGGGGWAWGKKGKFKRAKKILD